jgi:cyclophilin family peptidyl-prolyl cis-trans isomerase
MKYLKTLPVILALLVLPVLSACSSEPEPRYAIVETSLGSFKIELFNQDAPNTVRNFVDLAESGFYDDIIFHRIIQSFMVQTGDPNGNGTGGPGYTIDDELPVKRSYDPGIVAMANRGAPNTGGSQFFICTGTQALSLNQNPSYTQFGKVVEGMDVVQAIAAVPVTHTATGELSKPIDPPYIIGITITA